MVKGTTAFPTKLGHTVQVIQSFTVQGGTPGVTVSNLQNAVNAAQPAANYIVSLHVVETGLGIFSASGDAAILTPEPV